MQRVLISTNSMSEEKLKDMGETPDCQLSRINDELNEFIIVNNGLNVSSNDRGKHDGT